VCLNALRSVFQHLEHTKRYKLANLSDDELVEALGPYSRVVGSFFASMGQEQMKQFRALRGIQGQTTGTRRLQEAIRREDPTFDPPELKEFIEREKAQTTARAYGIIQSIEQILQSTIVEELKREYQPGEQDWWFNGVPKNVRKKVDDRINEEGGKGGGREQNFDLIDYREIIVKEWPLFESIFARGKGNKEAKTKWISEVNDLRKPVMHASKGAHLPITEEQVAFLEEIRDWLEARVTADGQVSETAA